MRIGWKSPLRLAHTAWQWAAQPLGIMLQDVRETGQIGADMQDVDAQKMAMFRFGLIAPVINNTFAEPSKMAYYRAVTSDVLTLPNGKRTSYSPSTLSYWEMLYSKGGFDALVHKARSDKGYPRKLTQEAIDALYTLRKEFPKINATMIYEKLIEDGIICATDASLCTVQRFVRAHAGDICGQTQQKDRKAFEAERVLGLWQADTLYGPYVGVGKDKKRAYLISIIDDKSRLIVGGRFFLADTTANFQKVFKDAILRFGLPEKCYFDNGAPYKNGQLSGICGRLGVVLIHTPVRDGAAKGKIERFNSTVRTRCLSVLKEKDTTSLDALNDAFLFWLNTYNTAEHTAIGASPVSVYRKEEKCVRRPKSTEWLAECFLNRITRKVKGDATVTVDKVSYDVPCALINMRVEIRYLPQDTESVHVVFEGKTYPVRPTNKVENSKAKRNKNYPIDYSKKGCDKDVSPTIPA
jgi:transposase InsO family protein